MGKRRSSLLVVPYSNTVRFFLSPFASLAPPPTGKDEGEDDEVQIVKYPPNLEPEIIEIDDSQPSEPDVNPLLAFLDISDLINPSSKRITYPNPNFSSIYEFNKFVVPTDVDQEECAWVRNYEERSDVLEIRISGARVTRNAETIIKNVIN